MNKKKPIIQALFAVFAMLLFIFDAKTAAAGVRDGIEICLNVVIPSLLPFFIVTTYLNAAVSGSKFAALQFINKRLRIPAGGESILILGLTGGYPVGAKLIGDLYRAEKLDKHTAHILLGYCNNAGPAFIFGIAGAAFPSPYFAFFLWFVNIISAITTGLLLPKPDLADIKTNQQAKVTLTQAIKSSLSACVSVCGWVIVFKILLCYLHNWFYNIFTTPIGIAITGLLELSNGCVAAVNLESPAIRFILLSVFFAFGGFCVFLQTMSVTNELGTGLYIHGKLIQTCISLITACTLSPILFSDCHVSPIIMHMILMLSVITITITAMHAKKCGNWMSVHV